MPCYSPIKGFRGVDGSLVMARHKSTGIPMHVPCRQCIGCRIERSRQWGVRMMHEASLHRDNCFVTLTYADHSLPVSGSLNVVDVQKFFKRFRKEIAPTKIRYFHCGEYGGETGRPHYHLALFGYDFPDKVLVAERSGYPVWRSDLLERLWSMGNCEIGSLTFDSAVYIAKYITKRVTGRLAESHYSRVDPDTGEVFQIAPEYATMSRRPGIGAGWLKKYKGDVYPSDEVIVNGHSCKPPAFYDRMLPEAELEAIKARRRDRRDSENQTDERLAVREIVKRSELSTFTKERSL